MRPKKVEEVKGLTELVRLENEFNSYTRGYIKDFIYQEWEELYLDNIKDPTLRIIKETLGHSPYKGNDNEKFYKYSNEGINNWISLVETYPDARDLQEYCCKNRERYQISAKTRKAIFKKVDEMFYR